MADEHSSSGPSQPATPTEMPAPTPTETAVPTPGDGADGMHRWGITPDVGPLLPADGAAPQPLLAPPRTEKPETPPEAKDVFREVAETIVFVVVLVLLLKTFVAEAFVIPTGSMATTLWGYQKYITCPHCKYEFPVNCSSQVDPQSDRPRSVVTSCECPNCRIGIDFAVHGIPVEDWHSGDRVLVFKSLFDTPIGSPHRHDVVVFKYPVEPQKNHVAMNYIKRLIGLPGETLAIAQGQLYVYDQPRQVAEPEGQRYWDSPYSGYPWRGTTDEARKEHDEAEKRFQQGQFQIIRKSPDLIPALRRIVFDNDYQPADTTLYPPRWLGEKGWQGDGNHPRRFSQAQPPAALEWLRYRHQFTGGGQPQLITDFMGYNSANDESRRANGDHWVGDLILECEVQIDRANADGELRLELSKGSDRFQARFHLQSGECSLVRIDEKGEHLLPLKPGDQTAETAKRATAVKGAGKFQLRFANVDEQLILWVNEELTFGNGVPYAAAAKQGPTANDLQPVSVGVKGAVVHASGLKLWRDTYYTTYSPGVSKPDGGDVALSGESLTDPLKWDALKELRQPTPMIMYVHPGHYLCLGDNSPASADSRSWGLVPERLLLGRALVVYFPFYCPYPPLNSPTNRTGAIK